MNIKARDIAYLQMLLDRHWQEAFNAGAAHDAGLIGLEDSARDKAKAVRREIEEMFTGIA